MPPGLLCLFISLRNYVRMVPELETQQALRNRLVRRGIVKLVFVVQFNSSLLKKAVLRSLQYIAILLYLPHSVNHRSLCMATR